MKLSKEETLKIFDKIDTDSSGDISYAEFFEAFDLNISTWTKALHKKMRNDKDYIERV